MAQVWTTISPLGKYVTLPNKALRLEWGEDESTVWCRMKNLRVRIGIGEGALYLVAILTNEQSETAGCGDSGLLGIRLTVQHIFLGMTTMPDIFFFFYF